MEVTDLMLRAQTLDEVEVAKKVRDEWLRDHPDDWGVIEAGEQLVMMEWDLKGELPYAQ
jgi:hypothetical protein